MGSKINVSTARQYVRSSGLNSSNESIKEMQDAIDTFAKKVVAKAKELAEEDKRKTILAGVITQAASLVDLTDEHSENEDNLESDDEESIEEEEK